MNDRMNDSEIAKRYGIHRSTYANKSKAMKKQIRDYVEAGGDKAVEDALVELQKWCYRVSVARKSAYSVTCVGQLIEVVFSDCHTFSGCLYAKDILSIATEVANLIKAG